ncbi:hypothetical protein QJS66_18340 [Kocuria rhizophila]|nr:hypothetical protein QJS66_18340 [Kocuria rhizophila]
MRPRRLCAASCWASRPGPCQPRTRWPSWRSSDSSRPAAHDGLGQAARTVPRGAWCGPTALLRTGWQIAARGHYE